MKIDTRHSTTLLTNEKCPIWLDWKTVMHPCGQHEIYEGIYCRKPVYAKCCIGKMCKEHYEDHVKYAHPKYWFSQFYAGKSPLAALQTRH